MTEIRPRVGDFFNGPRRGTSSVYGEVTHVGEGLFEVRTGIMDGGHDGTTFEPWPHRYVDVGFDQIEEVNGRYCTSVDRFKFEPKNTTLAPNYVSPCGTVVCPENIDFENLHVPQLYDRVVCVVDDVVDGRLTSKTTTFVGELTRVIKLDSGGYDVTFWFKESDIAVPEGDWGETETYWDEDVKAWRLCKGH